MPAPLIVAVDGPSGSGKSSVSRGVATEFGYRYLDTGAMYRAVTWRILDLGVDPTDSAAVGKAVATIAVVSGTDPSAPQISVDGTDVAVAIRGEEVTEAVSLVSAVPEVRSAMVALQRHEAEESKSDGTGIVIEGRDIGTVVLPDADVKVSSTAHAAVRAQRRAPQDEDRDPGPSGAAATEESLRRRDAIDSQRKASPLKPADDAEQVDATELDLEQTVEAVARLVRAVAP